VTLCAFLCCGTLAAQPLTLARKTFTRPWSAEFEGDMTFSFQQLRTTTVVLGTDNEVVGSASGDEKIYSVRLSPALGVFLVKGLQAGIQPLFVYSQADCEASEGFASRTEKEIGGGMDVFLRYVIDTRGSIYPFLGFSIGGIGGKVEKPWGESGFDVFEVGPQLGIKFIVGGRGILTLSFSYQFQSFGLESADGREARHTISFGTGLGFWL
jgi:hypothetical protein